MQIKHRLWSCIKLPVISVNPSLLLFKESNCFDLIFIAIYGYWPKLFWYLIRVDRRQDPITVIDADLIEDTIENIIPTVFSVLFRQFCSCLKCLTLQDPHVIRTLSVNIKCSCTQYEICQKNSPKELPFYPFLKFVQINYIFSDNLLIWYMLYLFIIQLNSQIIRQGYVINYCCFVIVFEVFYII